MRMALLFFLEGVGEAVTQNQSVCLDSLPRYIKALYVANVELVLYQRARASAVGSTFNQPV